eukprot:125554-Prorocentrum_minimum.AAC.1
MAVRPEVTISGRRTHDHASGKPVPFRGRASGSVWRDANGVQGRKPRTSRRGAAAEVHRPGGQAAHLPGSKYTQSNQTSHPGRNTHNQTKHRTWVESIEAELPFSPPVDRYEPGVRCNQPPLARARVHRLRLRRRGRAACWHRTKRRVRGHVEMRPRLPLPACGAVRSPQFSSV